MRSARDQSPSLPIDVLGISLQRVPHVEAWRVGCHLNSPPRHSTGVPNDTVYMCVELVTEGSELANMVAKVTKLAANLVSKNDANLALPPRFHQVLIESPL
ncbi:hypothetical protein TNCV_4711771 [Trichonephila clavipes]|nr:hypothetical protein TNCV_4711771 [Trichonephila clavipes]